MLIFYIKFEKNVLKHRPYQVPVIYTYKDLSSPNFRDLGIRCDQRIGVSLTLFVFLKNRYMYVWFSHKQQVKF